MTRAPTTMSTVARLLLPLSLLPLLLPVPAVRAQEDSAGVRLSVMSQTSFATRDRPFRVRLRAVNDTESPLRDLTVSLSVFPAARSRSEYGQALEFDPEVIPVTSKTQQLAGRLAPGESRRFSVESKLRFLEPFGGNALHPVTIQLASDFTPVAELRTMVVFIQEDPKVPLNVGLTFVLDAPLRLRPDGTFDEGALEAEIAPGGSVDRIVAALEDVPVQATLVVGPLLLVQLERMADGYAVSQGGGVEEVGAADPPARRATDMLGRIQALARSPATEVVALPFAAPSIPAMVDAGLEEDLERQLERGRAEVQRILGVPPVETLFRPPGSALTAEAVEALADQGIESLLVDAQTLPPSEGFRLTPPPTGEVPSGDGDTLVAITPDPGVAGRADGPRGNAALRAQWVLGELSAIYLERPSRDRGAALVFDGQDLPEPTFLRALLRGIGATPSRVQWLRPVKASRLLAIEPRGPRELNPTRETFSGVFLSEMTTARERVGQFASMAGDRVPLVDRLRTLLLMSQHRGLVGSDLDALGYLRTVDRVVAAEFSKVEPPPTAVTLTSQEGPIPVTIRSDLGYDARVVIRLRASPLQFLEGQTRQVVLSRPTQLYTFPVRAQTTGRFPVSVEVLTPAGMEIAKSQIVVRSTAYNVVALVITIGAALFLAALWARRFLPRRT